MAIEVFWSSGSGFSWRVLLALEHKGVPYQSRLLSFSKRENRTPEYLALNPSGRVPTLRDGEVVVAESVAILAYLERRFPERPLFGTSAAEAGRIWQLVMEAVNYLDAPTEAFILPIYFGQMEEKAAELRAAIAPLHGALARLEALAQASPWLAGGGLTAADFTVYPMVKSITRASGKPAAAGLDERLTRLAAAYPALGAWMQRVEALPYYERTYPPHWRGG